MIPWEFVTCRTVGHQWALSRITTNADGYKMIMMSCQSCGLIRDDTVNPRSGSFKRRYTYPEGYSLPEKRTRAEWRVMLLRNRRVRA